MFISTYGFSKNTHTRPQSWGRLVHKVICAENNAEIYQIGTIHTEQRLSDKIYILVWKERVIPFVVPLPITIAKKEIIHYKKHNDREYLPTNYTIPVVSTLVKDIGKDLLKLPKTRGHYVYYDRYCFTHEDRHYYAFESEQEYQNALKLIKLGLPVFFYDQYEPYTYEPMLSAEIVFGVGPWNFEDNLYCKEMEAKKRYYESEYRQCNSVHSDLERARKNLVKKDAELKRLKEINKRFLKGKSTFKTHFSINKHAKKVAQKCIKNFKKDVKSIEEFLEFLRIHPLLEKNDTKEIIDSERNVQRKISIHSTLQGRENWECFLELLVTSGHPILNKFEEYKLKLQEQAAFEVERHIPEDKERYGFNVAQEKLKQFSDENTDSSVEEIMTFLISLECPFHAEYGSFFDTRILQETAFIDLVKKSYKQNYSEICSSHEGLLVCITKTITTRINHRITRERADKKT